MTYVYSISEMKVKIIHDLPYKIKISGKSSVTDAKKWCYDNFGKSKFYDWSAYEYLDKGGVWDIYKDFYFLNEKDALLFKLTWG